MNQKLSQIFKSIGNEEPSENLKSLILIKIAFEKSKKINRNLFLSYFTFLISTFVAVYSILSLGYSLLHSEFWGMISLIYSDILVVAGNWKTFGYSLLETFPVINVIALMTPLFSLFVSFSFFVSLRERSKKMHIVNKFKFI